MVLVRAGMPLVLLDENGDEIDLVEYANAEDSRRGRLRNTTWSLRSAGDIGRITDPQQRRPTSAELTTLALLRNLLKDDVPRSYPLFNHLRVLLEELHRWMAGRMGGGDRAGMVEMFLRQGRQYLKEGPEADTIVLVGDAIRREAVIEGEYTLHDGRTRTMQILPLAAFFSEGRGHLFGARGLDGELRVYRLDRLASPRLVRDAPKPRYDQKAATRMINGNFGGFIAEPKKVRLRIAARIAYLFDEYKFHPSQKVRKRADGGVDVSLTCAASYSLEEWILGFGEFAEVLAPRELRETIIRRHAGALALYGTASHREDATE
jgi:hypothetical protein